MSTSVVNFAPIILNLFSHTLVDVHHADNVEAVWMTSEYRKVNRLKDQAPPRKPTPSE